MYRFSGLALVAGLAIAAVGPAFAQSDEPYEGPSILTRDSTTAGQRAGKLLDFQFWGDITGVADNGLTPVSLNSSGQVNTQGTLLGVEGGVGASGSKRWESDQVSLDYRGTWREYNGGGDFNGTDQLLDLQWQHRVSRHVELTVHEVGGISSLSFGQLSYVPLANTDLLGVPLNELFDDRTYYSQSTVNLEWQKSARLSFNIGGMVSSCGAPRHFLSTRTATGDAVTLLTGSHGGRPSTRRTLMSTSITRERMAIPISTWWRAVGPLGWDRGRISRSTEERLRLCRLGSFR